MTTKKNEANRDADIARKVSELQALIPDPATPPAQVQKDHDENKDELQENQKTTNNAPDPS